jgi:hypothetical protein
MDFAQAIGKTPIVVNDARGFYTTRVVMAYQAESYDMLAQGIAPDLVELAGATSGMPVPPLALSDAVALDLIHQINLQAASDLGEAYRQTPGYAMVGRLVEELGRNGKKAGKGFYDYREDGSKRLWPGLHAMAARGAVQFASIDDLRDRLLAAQALETVRCLDEGVITMSARFLAGALRPGPAARSPTSMLREWRRLSRAAMNCPSATVASGYDHQRHCAGSPRTEARSTAQTGNAIECLCEFWRARSGPRSPHC